MVIPLGFSRETIFAVSTRLAFVAFVAFVAFSAIFTGRTSITFITLRPRGQLDLINIGTDFLDRIINSVMILNMGLRAHDRLRWQFHIPFSHHKLLSKIQEKPSRYQAFSSLRDTGLLFPRIISADIAQTSEVVDIPDTEPNLKLSTNSEHVPLPQVQLSATIIDSRLIRNRQVNVFNNAVVSRGPVTSKPDSALNSIDPTGNRSARTQQTRHSTISGRVDEQWTTDVICSAQQKPTSGRRQRPTIQDTIILSNRNISIHKTLINVLTQIGLRGVTQGIEVRPRRTRLWTKHGLIKPLSKSLWQFTHNLLVQSRLVTTELIRERNNDRSSVRRHDLVTKSRA